MQSGVCQHLRFLSVLLQPGILPQGGWAHLWRCVTIHITTFTPNICLFISICFHFWFTDIDECSQSIGHLCTYKCVNVLGSYQCACPEYGYTMSPNGRSCRGECQSPKSNTIQSLTGRLQICIDSLGCSIISQSYLAMTIIDFSCWWTSTNWKCELLRQWFTWRYQCKL